MKKVLIHSNYSPFSFGGIQEVVRQILPVLEELNFNYVCFFGAGSSSRASDSSGNDFVARRILFKLLGAPILLFGNFYFVKESMAAELVVFNEPFPTLWPAIMVVRRLLGKKVIVLVHADPEAQRLVRSAYRFLRGIVFSGSVCVSTSPPLLSRVRSERYLRNISIPLSCPVAPDLSSFNCDLCLPERYALYVGRLAKYKGIETLIGAVLSSPDVQFVIAGTGPLASFVARSIARHDLPNLMFINSYVSNELKYFLISKCEFLLLPSDSINEAFGIIQLEAMCNKKAIINTSLNNGVNFVAPNALCAITVRPKCSADLAKAIQTLWDDQVFASDLGERGYSRYSELFKSEFFFIEWIRLIRAVL